MEKFFEEVKEHSRAGFCCIDSFIPQRWQEIKKATHIFSKKIDFRIIKAILSCQNIQDAEKIIEKNKIKHNVKIEKIEIIDIPTGMDQNLSIGYEVSIKNLKFNNSCPITFREKDFCFRHIIFKNCFFCSKEKNSQVMFKMNHAVKFKNNIFENVSITVKSKSIFKDDADMILLDSVDINKNVFKNAGIAINDFPNEKDFPNQTANLFIVDGGILLDSIINKFNAAKILEEMAQSNMQNMGHRMSNNFNEDYEKIVNKIKNNPRSCTLADILLFLYASSEKLKISPDDILNPIDKLPIIIRDNDIRQFESSIYAPVIFQGHNIMRGMKIDEKRTNRYGDSKQNIIWGRYHEIYFRKWDVHHYKNFFIDLKQIAAKNNDKSQNFILNRAILQCDHFLIRQEPFWKSLQDRIIMRFGQYSSNHGVSWVIPLVWLFLSNLFLSAVIFYAIGTPALTMYYLLDILGEHIKIPIWEKYLQVFLEMINPVSNLSNTLEEIGVSKGIIKYNRNFISGINVLQKAVFAVLVYELIRVGRRFIAK